MDKGVVFVQNKLENMGFCVDRISESDRPRPDLVVSVRNATYVIEVKTKEPNAEVTAKRDEILESGDIFSHTEPLGPRNLLSGLVKNAAKQLRAYSRSELTDFYSIVWLYCVGLHAEDRCEQFINTLYGSTMITDWDGDFTGPCYFFRNSEFYRHRNTLDAAVVSTDENLLLCLNPLSHRYEKVKETKLISELLDWTLDPLEWEARGEALFVDGAVDRGNQRAILDFLRKKYSLGQRTTPFDWNCIRGEMPIPFRQFT